MFNRSNRHIKKSAFLALAYAITMASCALAKQLTGRYGYSNKPSSFIELLDYLPLYLISALLLFIGAWIWNSWKREDGYFICSRCGNIYKNIDIDGKLCPKCHTMLEELEGYYERHPDKKDPSSQIKVESRVKEIGAESVTCYMCNTTYPKRVLHESVCPNCGHELRL